MPMRRLRLQRQRWKGWLHSGKREITTFFTTFERENMRGYKGICEFLSVHKMPGKPGNTGYTGI